MALARQSWIRAMATHLEARGYFDYKASDAAVFRLLLRSPAPIGHVGGVLGVSRQAGKKVVDGLRARGLAEAARDPEDHRRVRVALTERGSAYGRAIVEVIDELNASLTERVSPEDLRAADRVLRSSILDPEVARRVARVDPPF